MSAPRPSPPEDDLSPDDDLPADDAGTTRGAQSIRRALAVLRIVASGQERGVRLIDAARATGLNRTTVHRILRVLIDEGAVEQDRLTRSYLIGREMALLGLARTARFPIRAIAEPHLRHLADTLGDTTFLTIRNGVDSVCIDRRPGSYPVKVLSIEIGARRPLGAGVSGLVLLAGLPPDEARQIVQRNGRRLAQLGIDGAALLARAEQARTLGYAFAPHGVVPGTRAVAVPVRRQDGRTVAGIALTATSDRLPDERLPPLVARMSERARLIAERLDEIAGRNTSRGG